MREYSAVFERYKYDVFFSEIVQINCECNGCLDFYKLLIEFLFWTKVSTKISNLGTTVSYPGSRIGALLSSGRAREV